MLRLQGAALIRPRHAGCDGLGVVVYVPDNKLAARGALEKLRKRGSGLDEAQELRYTLHGSKVHLVDDVVPRQVGSCGWVDHVRDEEERRKQGMGSGER